VDLAYDTSRYSDSISFYLITLFIPCLNFSINGYLLYLLSFATFLNSCINSCVFNFCSIFFNSIIFIVLLFPPSNSYLRLVRKFFTIANLKLSFSKSFIIFSFQILANSLYMLEIQRLNSILFFFSFLFLSVYAIIRTMVRDQCDVTCHGHTVT